MKKILLFLVILCCTSCSVMERFTATKTPTQTPTPEATETPMPTLTPTPPPSAAIVNGVYIWLDDYNAKREQLRDAYSEIGEAIPADDALNQEVLNSLEDETLFLAAAIRDGIAPDENALDERINRLADSMGGPDALRSWQNANHYTEEGFRRALEREVAAEKVKERLFEEKLPTIEQLHVYRISSDARNDLTEVQNNLGLGFAFETLAADEGDETGGDMGWFPRGVLFYPELEDAIFALEAGSVSDIIEREGTYYLFYVAEKQTGREMDAQVKQIVCHNLVSEWLANERNNASIEHLIQ